MARRRMGFGVLASVSLAVAAIALSSWIWQAACLSDSCAAMRESERLTEQHRTIVEAVLNHYFAITDSPESYENPRELCATVAMSSELNRCFITHDYSHFIGDYRKVQRLRIIDYQEDCLVGMVVYSTMGSTGAWAFLLRHMGEQWLVAEIGDAQGEFNRPTPNITVTCN